MKHFAIFAIIYIINIHTCIYYLYILYNYPIHFSNQLNVLQPQFLTEGLNLCFVWVNVQELSSPHSTNTNCSQSTPHLEMTLLLVLIPICYIYSTPTS
jgi:hypothetical protein